MIIEMKYDKPSALRVRYYLLIKAGFTIEGTYGLLGNHYPESGFRSNNGQNSGMNRLGVTDEIYTAIVDSGEYKNFTTDGIGYGLCQWTSAGRKAGLLNYARSRGVSIGNEAMQLDYMILEMKQAYKDVYEMLRTSHDVEACAKYVMLHYERPGNQTEENQDKRAKFALQLMEDLGIPTLYTVDEFIAKTYEYLQKHAPKYDIHVYPAIIAQGILESARATSELAINANNYFGLKYKTNRCPTAHKDPYYKIGSEQNPDGSYVSSTMKWCQFDNLEQCVIGYLDFISHSRYSALKGVTDTKRYLELIKAAGYATSLKYVNNVYDVVINYGLLDYGKKEDTQVSTNTSDIKIRKILLTNNDCYKKGKKIKPVGIVVHSTGANNKKVSRYVQPDDGVIGTNKYRNHWNQGGIKKCVHAFIGIDKNGDICIVQTLPWDYKCWGVGSGKYGSYNNSHIQFEICEDALADEKYFNQVFEAAAELCAYLMKLYPTISTDNVVSHHESYIKGYGGNHRDCDHWLRKFGKNMTWFRAQVASKVGKVNTNESTTPATPTAPAPSESKPSTSTPATVSTYTVVKGDTLSKIGNKVNMKWQDIATLNNIRFPYVIRVGQVLKLSTTSTPTTQSTYKVRVLSTLDIYKSPNGAIQKSRGVKKGLYTIVETDGNWGLLKSYKKNRNGWINLTSVTKL